MNLLSKIVQSIWICMLCACASSSTYIKKDIINATGRLEIFYADKMGSCTTVAYEKMGNKYRFFTAAHCVADYDAATSTTKVVKANMLIIMEGDNGHADAYRPTVIAVGDMSKNEDFAILEVEIDKYTPILALDSVPVKLDEDVAVITAPLKIGNLFLRGNISKEVLYNDLLGADMNWKGCIVVQVVGLGVANASSGSALIRRENGKVIGIVVASVFNTRAHISLLVIPITQFIKFDLQTKLNKKALNFAEEPLIWDQNKWVCE